MLTTPRSALAPTDLVSRGSCHADTTVGGHEGSRDDARITLRVSATAGVVGGDGTERRLLKQELEAAVAVEGGGAVQRGGQVCVGVG